MPLHRLQRVLRNDPDPDDAEFFEKVMYAVGELARYGFRFQFESEEQSTHTLEQHWSDEGDLAHISLIKELDSSICSFSIVATRVSDLRRIFAVLDDELEFDSLSDLHRQAAAGLMRRSEVLIKMALSCSGSPVDAETAEHLRRGLEHRYPRVRFHAAWAVGITCSPIFIHDLETLLKLEPNEDVREKGEQALNGCRREERLAAR